MPIPAPTTIKLATSPLISLRYGLISKTSSMRPTMVNKVAPKKIANKYLSKSRIKVAAKKVAIKITIPPPRGTALE